MFFSFQTVRGLTFLQLCAISIGLFFTHALFTAIYNVYFHPLRNFPGPFWAKVTIFYEYYWDNIQDGQFTNHCYEVLHPKYGPVVRVAPHKLRVNGTGDFFKIHAMGTTFTKDPHFYSHGNREGVLALLENKPHHERRKLLAPLFSKTTIAKLQPLVQEKIDRLLIRIKADERKAGLRRDRYVFDCFRYFQAIVSDVLMKFAFEKSYDALGQESLTHSLLESSEKLIENIPTFKYLPGWAHKIIQAVPPWLAQIILKPIGEHSRFQAQIFTEIVDLFKRKNAGLLKPRAANEPPTVFSELIDIYPSEHALSNDSVTIYSAGSITVTHNLSHAVFLLAKNKVIHQRVFQEIKAIWPTLETRPSYEQLEKLPYLTAVVKEVLRLSPGVIGGIARRVPKGGVTLSDRFIPEDTSIDSSIYNMNMNPDVFHDPFKFDPERWLQPDSILLEKYSVSFGLGSRNCLGIYLAYLEIYMILAAIIRNFEWECTEVCEREGWKWVDRWSPAKRGDPGTFYFKSRAE
ncbi:cytochrome P450 [Ascobolus immersus RN42]|uniref:Cytochrome P450 n=1 Tax=Ascobolus immersus RN42 TaxID=1160509 RepID=A0A3N4I2K0_ASCIM|nr:cytochrome P450 [Ascobolus immersus RN42]